MTPDQRNWATNIVFQRSDFHIPETLTDLQEIVGRADRVKMVGSRHCFNAIADTTGAMISLERMDKGVTFDAERRTATVSAGMSYAQLAPLLHEAGYALPNMASIPQITVMGACATATHGSGDANGNLATAVSGLEMVRADGERVWLSREHDGDLFNGVVVGLGSLGVVTRVTLEVVPTFAMQQVVYERLPVAELEAHFDEIMASAYSVSLFSDWTRPSVNQVWRKHLLADGRAIAADASFFGATPAAEHHHPVDANAADPCTAQLGIPGPGSSGCPTFTSAAHYHRAATCRANISLRGRMPSRRWPRSGVYSRAWPRS